MSQSLNNLKGMSMTYIGIYSGSVSPRLIATSDDPDLVEEVARRMLADSSTKDPDLAVRHLERGRREALREISKRGRPKLSVITGAGA